MRKSNLILVTASNVLVWSDFSPGVTCRRQALLQSPVINSDLTVIYCNQRQNLTILIYDLTGAGDETASRNAKNFSVKMQL